MSHHPPTLILRHRRENLQKCSLRGLEGRQDMCFYTYPKDKLPLLDSYILLTLDAPVLSKEDEKMGLFLIDGTWRHAQTMYRQLTKPHLFLQRSLPQTWKTAYPRRQEDCEDPERGLASVEALFAAYTILGRDTKGLLDFYYWKNSFLEKNGFPILTD
jgi:pre-rRNA-processing protein TSR3